MTDAFDLVVIGSGTAASLAASRAARAGWRVAIVDQRPLGGTCALRGCDPKKMMVSAEEALDAAVRMHGRGVGGALRIAWPELMAFKRSFTDPIPAKRRARFEELGIAALPGVARFTAPDRLCVSDRELRFRHALIATGARPATLGIPGEDLVATSDAFLELEALPRRTIFIGGGYIAAEFSHLAARGGAKVTVLQRGPRLLDEFDADMVDLLMPSFAALGIGVELRTEAVAVRRAGSRFLVESRSADRGERTFEADLIVHAAGRTPALEQLDLAAGEVEAADGRLRLDAQLRSVSNPRVYAAGDAAAVGPPLTPVSSHDANVAIENILGNGPVTPDYRGVPSVAFTVPPIAAAGLGEDEARRQRLRIEVHSKATPEWFSARRMAESIYGHKIIVEAGTGKVLGAHLVGPHADEVINLFALAIRHGLGTEQLKQTLFAYPTGASDIGSMLE